MQNDFFNAMKMKTDEEFLEILCNAAQQPVVNGVSVPGFTDDEFQRLTVGSAGGASLRGEGAVFYKAVKSYAGMFSGNINPNMKILDFGCGWGRMIRFFFKDMYEENIYGIDVDPEMVKRCNETLHYGNYSVTPALPPTHFQDNMFDIIFAYSVFSHLKPEVAEKWIQEFSRILKPNGILVATTQGKGFLNYCKDHQENPDKINSVWLQNLVKNFNPIAKFQQKYGNGEAIYIPTGGGANRDSSFYGEALLPGEYIQNNFTRYLKLRSFVEDNTWLPQAVFVMQK